VNNQAYDFDFCVELIFTSRSKFLQPFHRSNGAIMQDTLVYYPKSSLPQDVIWVEVVGSFFQVFERVPLQMTKEYFGVIFSCKKLSHTIRVIRYKAEFNNRMCIVAEAN
jgi:hypothetical protein